VRKHFGMPLKSTPYHLMDGRTWDEMTRATQDLVAEGAMDEVESIWRIFHLFMRQGFPPEELKVVDTTIKMFTEPVLRADVDLLAKIWEGENERKANRLGDLGVAATDLASADRFADLLRAEGIEPETKQGKNGLIYAFAKTDDFMRELQDHDNERVRMLAEARLGEKSTLMQTRAATMGWMASRGSLCVYLRYAGTGTLRVSGGDGSNWLNFKRQSPLRKTTMAPDGYVLAPIDASQIECRVLHYLAGGPREPVIEKFRSKEDPYVDLASQFYKEPIYKPKRDDPRFDEMEAKRGMGKQGRLMCLGPSTAVLTNNGVKPITQVCDNDLLWDGVEWVKHQGLIYQGEQHVVKIAGVLMTFDHQILCAHDTWLPAAWLRSENILSLALGRGSANLPSLDMNWAKEAAYFTWYASVRAEHQSTQLHHQIFTSDGVHAVRLAPDYRPDFGLKNIMVMPTFALTNHTVGGCSAVFHVSTSVVRQMAKTSGMADEVSKSAQNGEVQEDVEKFWHIWLRWMAGIIPNSKLIEKITTRVTPPATFSLRLASNKCETDAASNNWNKKSPTYDLGFAGPRNRFTILSERGALIVHNCGYGAAGLQFKVTAKNGLYGPSVDISIEDAQAFVKLYRETNPSICGKTGYWQQGEWVLGKLAAGATAEWGPLTIKNKRICLPSGQPVNYDSLEFHVPDADEQVRDFERNGYWRMRTRHGWKKMWGSKIVQNMCEAVSRVIVSQAMNRITAMGYRVLNWPYDELLILIPKDGREEQHAQRCAAEMKVAPAWLPDLPLDAEYSLAERYSK
jgi:hypothetical protein